MTTNIAECMNAILRDAREMPLVPLLETICSKLQQWFHDRQTIAGNMNISLTTWTEERLKIIIFYLFLLILEVQRFKVVLYVLLATKLLRFRNIHPRSRNHLLSDDGAISCSPLA